MIIAFLWRFCIIFFHYLETLQHARFSTISLPLQHYQLIDRFSGFVVITIFNCLFSHCKWTGYKYSHLAAAADLAWPGSTSSRKVGFNCLFIGSQARNESCITFVYTWWNSLIAAAVVRWRQCHNTNVGVPSAGNLECAPFPWVSFWFEKCWGHRWDCTWSYLSLAYCVVCLCSYDEHSPNTNVNTHVIG